jgi:hypothetical protein
MFGFYLASIFQLDVKNSKIKQNQIIFSLFLRPPQCIINLINNRNMLGKKYCNYFKLEVIIVFAFYIFM